MLTNEKPENFIEGVNVQLVHKGKVKAKYQPGKMEEVTDQMVNEIIQAKNIPDLGLVDL
jgi:hypothetical protein